MNRGGWTALEPRQRHVLMSTVAANALIFLDQTAVVVALPAIGREFDTRAHELQWVITAYLLALAVFMPAAGPLADNIGRNVS
jgi:MFS family permease